MSEFRKLTPSKSRKGIEHLTRININTHCTCEAFQHSHSQPQQCRHVEEFVIEVGRAMAALKLTPRKKKRFP